jgi:hypothetical protein
MRCIGLEDDALEKVMHAALVALGDRGDAHPALLQLDLAPVPATQEGDRAHEALLPALRELALQPYLQAAVTDLRRGPVEFYDAHTPLPTHSDDFIHDQLPTA